MTNEDKILDILAAMQGEMTAMRSDMNARFDKVEGDITKINIKLENVIEPKINALAEGRKSIVEMLVPRSRIDDLEEEVKMLKVFMRQMGEELHMLKKAQ